LEYHVTISLINFKGYIHYKIPKTNLQVNVVVYEKKYIIWHNSSGMTILKNSVVTRQRGAEKREVSGQFQHTWKHIGVYQWYYNVYQRSFTFHYPQ
jgi:hypothetical protein